MPLLVVGSVAYDSIQTPTAVRERVIGGSATYFSYAASYFTPVRLVGVVGEDWEEENTRLLKSRGIDTSGLMVVKGAKTFYWKGKYLSNMNDRETLDIQLNVFGDFNPVLSEDFRRAKYVFLANGSPVLQMKVLDQVVGPHLVVADTMDLWIRNFPSELAALLKRIDGLVMNDSEAKLLSGTENLVLAGHRVREMGPRFVVIKKGEHGAMFFSEHETYVLPAFPTERVVDPTGAGRQLRRRHDGLPGERGQVRSRESQAGDGVWHSRRQLQRGRFQPGAHEASGTERFGSADGRV